MTRQLTVVSHKKNGNVHRKWHYDVIHDNGDPVAAWCPAGRAIAVADGTRSSTGLAALALFWPSRWYNVVCLFEPSTREFLGYYCNVTTPPAVRGRTLEYVDLDLDVKVARDRTWEVVDEDEFWDNARLLDYEYCLIEGAAGAVVELAGLINSGSCPFRNSFVDGLVRRVPQAQWTEAIVGGSNSHDLKWWRDHQQFERPGVVPQWAIAVDALKSVEERAEND